MLSRRALALASLLAAACGHGAEPADALSEVADATAACPNDLPASCPSPAPGYATTVGPLLASRCASCHQPGGVASARALTTYAQIYARRGAVLTQSYACLMPPPDAGVPLTSAERTVLLGWLVCGAPEN